MIDHDGRGEALLAADPACERSVQRIERDGQDERPDHQRQERREDDVAKPRQHSDQPGTNQHIEKAGRDDGIVPLAGLALGSGSIAMCAPTGPGHAASIVPRASERRCHSSSEALHP